MKKDFNRKSVIYTSGVLEKIYNLKTSNVIQCSNNRSYSVVETSMYGENYYIGLCSNKYHAHILNYDEIFMLEILLSWEVLSESDGSSNTIMFNDIDWLRNHYKQNKDNIKLAHQLYKKVLNKLSTLYFICTSERIIDISKCEGLDKLIDINLIYEDGIAIGVKYSFGELGKILRLNRQITIFEGNIYNIKLSESMKYRLLRYIVISVFMNRVRGKSFKRTHRSILQGITCNIGNTYISYYDDYINKKLINKYLRRYLTRLKEVLELLKESGYIKEYVIEPIRNSRELQLGFGIVEIYTNMSRKRRKYKNIYGH